MRALMLLAALAGASATSAGYYWYNLNTGESMPTRPDCVGLQDTKSNGRSYWIVKGKASWKPLPECGWVAANSTDGHTYYYNTETKANVWERPDALSWVKMSRDKNSRYYVNSVTQ